MPPKMVRVELGDNGLPVRIFRKDKKWLECPEDKLAWMAKAEAVGKIREQVYERSRSSIGPGCGRCGKRITWDSFEMHETVPRGKGGEQSLENCEALCWWCHQGSPDSAHGNRRWQTSKLSEGTQ